MNVHTKTIIHHFTSGALLHDGKGGTLYIHWYKAWGISEHLPKLYYFFDYFATDEVGHSLHIWDHHRIWVKKYRCAIVQNCFVAGFFSGFLRNLHWNCSPFFSSYSFDHLIYGTFLKTRQEAHLAVVYAARQAPTRIEGVPNCSLWNIIFQDFAELVGKWSSSDAGDMCIVQPDHSRYCSWTLTGHSRHSLVSLRQPDVPMEDLNLHLVIYSLAISTATIYIFFTWMHKEGPFTVSGVLCFPTYSGALDISYIITSYLPTRYLAPNCWCP